MTIKPGVYLDMPAETYHAAEALSAGGEWEIVSDCPAAYRFRSPFNPERAPDEPTAEMTVGTAAHLAILEDRLFERRTTICDFDNFRTKAAQTARDDALAAGKVPLLPKQLAKVEMIRRAIFAHEKAAELLTGGESEVSLFWEESGVPMKARVDKLKPGLMVDLKTASQVSEEAITRAAERDGWGLRVAHYTEGLCRVTGVDRLRADARYVFVCVKQTEPHLVTIAELDRRWIEMGRIQRQHAIAKFKECRETGIWPAYCDDVLKLSPPDWTEKRFFERYDADEMTPRARAMLTELVP